MKIFDLLKALVSPLVAILASLTGVISVIIGAFLNPAGAVNGFVTRLIDALAFVWPSTPENLKLANLIFPAVGGVSIGRAVLIDICSTLFVMLGIILLIKLYKLIPFKMT